ncbi:hypothetical protein DPX16_0006, partial [Anabarilius grahami]
SDSDDESEACVNVAPRKRKNIDDSTPHQTPQVKLINDRRIRSSDDILTWRESQIVEWDRSSWTSDRYDEAAVRARQTPYPFYIATKKEDEEEEVWETESRNNDAIAIRNITTIINRRFDELNSRLDDINIRLDGYFKENQNRTASEFLEIHNKLDYHFQINCDRIAAEFFEVHNRLKPLNALVPEILDHIYHLSQSLENSLHRLQTRIEENHERILRELNDQLRERQLTVSLLSAMVTCVHPS